MAAASFSTLVPIRPLAANPILSHTGHKVTRTTGPSTPPFGVEATGWSPANAAPLASGVAAAGARWTRVNQLRWSVVQSTEGSSYDWTSYDAIMAAPTAKGLTPIVIIGDTPKWAAADPNLPAGPIAPEHLTEFARFVRTAAQRYGSPPYNVKYWELFNEPDSTTAKYAPWISTWGNDGAGYAAMLQAAYPAIREADSAAMVLSGSLAYDWFTTQGGPFNQQFVDDVLSAGGGQYFDVFGFHYYATFAPTWAAYGVDILGKTNYLRDVLTTHGLSSKPMACTEIGQFGVPGDSASLENQAEYVPQVYARGMSANLECMMWYSLNNGTDNTGLLNNGNPKPAYYVYQVAASELGPTSFAQVIPAADVGLHGAPARAFEGYLFQVDGGNTYRAVTWLTAGSATISVPVPSLDIVTKEGIRTTIPAGADGRVKTELGTSPLYLNLPSLPLWNTVYLPDVMRS